MEGLMSLSYGHERVGQSHVVIRSLACLALSSTALSLSAPTTFASASALRATDPTIRHLAPTMQPARSVLLPIEWRGTWQTSTLSGLASVDGLPQGPLPTGSVVQLKLAARAAFTWQALLQVAQQGCAHRVLVYETGMASLHGGT